MVECALEIAERLRDRRPVMRRVQCHEQGYARPRQRLANGVPNSDRDGPRGKDIPGPLSRNADSGDAPVQIDALATEPLPLLRMGLRHPWMVAVVQGQPKAQPGESLRCPGQVRGRQEQVRIAVRASRSVPVQLALKRRPLQEDASAAGLLEGAENLDGGGIHRERPHGDRER
jgi:hypothetical protein